MRRAAQQGSRAPGAQPLVRSVHLSSSRPGAHDLSAVVVLGGRVRAVAARITDVEGRWVLDLLQIG